MRAWRFHEYGGAERMRWEELSVPVPGEGQILVKLTAASVNPVDWKIREGWLAKAFPMSLPRTLGRDGAGTIVTLGAAVDGFAVGDRVAGVTTPGMDGTHAEYAVLAAAACAPLPAGIDLEAAATLGIAGLSAYIPLVEDAKLARGQTVLVHAGAGGVGGFAVQLAHHLGAHVIATCGPANADYVRALGADEVLDYTRAPLETLAARCDCVLDSIGGEVHNRSFVALKPGGIMVSLSAAPIPTAERRTDVRSIQSMIRPTRARLESLAALVAAGAVTPQITRTLPLESAREAYDESQKGHTRGKIVLVA